jgi:fructose-1,6-bisphosphatase/inositol monophosphatase family enzyme
MPLSTEAVLELLQSVADEVIRPRFRTLSESQIDEKKPGDLVTVADREAEELITAALLDAYPDAVVLGEEAYAGEADLLPRFREADHGFTVDPVDGTKNFVHGSPDYAVMVSEVVDGETVRGWIWQPEHDAAWVAELGSGVRRNGEPVHREPPRPPARRPAGPDRILGLLRGGLPQAHRGRGRLRALRAHQPVGPPARHADGP